MAPKRASKQQQQLNVDQFKLLKKPMDTTSVSRSMCLAPSGKAACCQTSVTRSTSAQSSTFRWPTSSHPIPRPGWLSKCRRWASTAREATSTVLDELKRWEDKDLQEYSQYIAEDGLLNEFKMMWELRESFPLHFTVFKQTACHLSHEANVEQVFSRAGLLADPNLLPAHLSTLVTVGFNKNAFKPQIAAIKDKYYEMFRNKTKS